MDVHEAEQRYKCKTCEKTFHLKWRLNKHEENHTRKNVKHCRYFSKQELCPYEAIGCKFLHVQTELCTIDDCQDITHQNVINIEEATNGEDKNKDEEEIPELEENPCHLCRIQLQTKDDLYNHVQVNHEEHFLRMMEVAARMRMSSSMI